MPAGLRPGRTRLSAGTAGPMLNGKMKRILILILGCIPLSILTVWSFVELGSIDRQLDVNGNPAQPPPGAERIKLAREQVAADKPPLEALAESDLLAGEAIRALRGLPDESTFKPLDKTWPQWTEALALATGFLEAWDSPTDNLDQLVDTVNTLKALEAKHASDPPQGSKRMLRVLNRRIAALEAKIKEITLAKEASERRAAVEAAFGSKDYEKCAALCREWLSEYRGVIDDSAVKQVESLEIRSRFWRDAARSSKDLRAATTPAEKQLVLKTFLDTYKGSAGLTTAEEGVLTGCTRELERLIDQAREARQDKDGEVAIGRLLEASSLTFGDRVRQAADIAERFPTPKVRTKLRLQVREWLAEAISRKQLREDERLEEVESREFGVLRGFFLEVWENNKLTGYKCYRTWKQRVDKGQAGFHPVDSLLGAPAKSVPRRCVDQYNEARAELLENPARRDAWTKLSARCEANKSDLRAYRKKPGSSNEQVSFDAEARFVQEVMKSRVRQDIEKLFGP